MVNRSIELIVTMNFIMSRCLSNKFSIFPRLTKLLSFFISVIKSKMSADQSPPPFNNWVKCSEGLIECSREAAKIVKNVIENWHQTDIHPKATEFQCAGSATCKPNLPNGTPNKPKNGRGYCAQCVKWADKTIPNLLAECQVPNKLSYEVYWQHAKSSDFYDHVIEVAKLFGLKNIKADALAAIKKFDDFDPAWLLSIMEKVKLFHSGDVQSQVSVIRGIYLENDTINIQFAAKSCTVGLQFP